MDSLHVSSSTHQTSGSKTSSRSASPCRPREAGATQTSGTIAATTSAPHRPHHTKTLSHGSVDSAKSQDGGGVSHGHRTSRHRSPTTSASRTGGGGGSTSTAPLEMDDSNASMLDDSVLLLAAGGANDSSTNFGGGTDHPDHSSFLSNGSSEHAKHANDDDCERVDNKTVTVLEQLRHKMVRVRDLMRTEQKLRDDNVNEYLKLASNADKQQVQRIKAVFEKKNQKSAQVISQLQKKLDSYQKRVNELETHGLTQSHRPPREVLRDMGQGLKNVGGNIRDGITGFSGSVMSKPREFAHLIKNKFGSADNISQLSTWYIGPGATGSEGSGQNGGSDQGEKHHLHHHHGSATLPATLHMAPSQNSMGRQHPATKFPSDEGSECSSDSIDRYRPAESSGTQDAQFKTVYSQLHIKQLEIDSLKGKLDNLKSQLENMHTCEHELNLLNVALQEEKFRRESLEEQVNDLTELHQNEVENLKQAMADMEEKVQYQSEERLRDIHEMLEHCQTKIQKMEHQALQQQQYVTLEGLDNSNARALVVKLINVLLTVLQVVLLLVATGAGIIMPFLRTRVRILTTVSIVLASVFILRQWPEVQDIGSHMMKRLKDMLDPVQ